MREKRGAVTINSNLHHREVQRIRLLEDPAADVQIADRIEGGRGALHERVGVGFEDVSGGLLGE